MAAKSDYVKINLVHKLHQLKSSITLKLQDFCMVFLDDEDAPIQKVVR